MKIHTSGFFRAVAALSSALALSSAHGFITYKSAERAKSSRTAYTPAAGSIDGARVFAEPSSQAHGALTLQLTSGRKYDVTRVSVLPGYGGGKTFVGYFTSHGEEYRIHLSELDGVYSGSMLSPEGKIAIDPAPSGVRSDVLITNRTKAGQVRAFSFNPDSVTPPPSERHGEAVRAAQEAARALGITAPQLEAASMPDRAKANTVIDLMVVYTPAMVTRHGTTAGAITRINNLVAVLNDALTRSQVTLTVRLVHAGQVSYSDTASNDDALTAISPGSTNAVKSTIDTQRNLFGADLVALIRPYNGATHAGCGLAWVLGGDGTGVQSWEANYGFSVISEGTSTTGNGFYCEDVSFAHELGHNFGLEHDRANSSVNPIRPYGFGYVNNAVGFGTIMSYFNGTRTAVFSNPNITCNGSPCGRPVGAADAAHASSAIAFGMTQIAAFRATASTTTDTDNDGIPDAYETSVARNYAVKDNDVFGVSTLFVMQQYRDFLFREADSAGLTFWNDRITAGTETRASTISSFVNSAEFGGTFSPIIRLYFAAFLRFPDYAGAVSWRNAFSAGTSLNTIANSFANSPEFLQRYGTLTNDAFVELLYNNVLGRPSDPSGKALWVGVLNNGSQTRGQVLAQFSESPEFVAQSTNRVRATMLYVGMLRRTPDSTGFNGWVAQLNAGASYANIINGFVGSTEYRNRFLP